VVARDLQGWGVGVKRAETRGVDPATLLQELDRQLDEALARAGEVYRTASPPGVVIRDRLVVALRDEIEAAEEAALWLVGERDLDLKLGWARQCGHQARHYRLITQRLEAMGAQASALDPLARGYSPMFRYLRTLETPAERLAAGAYARAGIARARHAAFAEQCEAGGDADTARLYREVIAPHEASQHAFGRRLLPRYAVAPDDQERARRAVARTLQLAEETQEVAARLGRGKPKVPGR
jgi:hypothetical protein